MYEREKITEAKIKTLVRNSELIQINGELHRMIMRYADKCLVGDPNNNLRGFSYKYLADLWNDHLYEEPQGFSISFYSLREVRPPRRKSNNHGK